MLKFILIENNVFKMFLNKRQCKSIIFMVTRSGLVLTERFTHKLASSSSPHYSVYSSKIENICHRIQEKIPFHLRLTAIISLGTTLTQYNKLQRFLLFGKKYFHTNNYFQARWVAITILMPAVSAPLTWRQQRRRQQLNNLVR